MANVLLVVNDAQAGHDLGAVLRSAGHSVVLEFDPRAALNALDHGAVDLLLCDAVLPGMFGTDLIVAARITLQQPDLPAILLSHLPPDLSYELFDAEPVNVLPAPYSGEQLIAMIEQLGFKSSAADRRRSAMSLVPGRRTGERPAAPTRPRASRARGR